MTLRRSGMRDPDLEARRVRRRRFEQALDLAERLLVAANALQRHDLAVADREDRLDVQQVPGERSRLADAPALGEVLERAHGEQEVMRVSPVSLDERVDLLVGRPTFEAPLDADREQGERSRHGPRVDHAHLVAPEQLRSALRARERARRASMRSAATGCARMTAQALRTRRGSRRGSAAKSSAVRSPWASRS